MLRRTLLLTSLALLATTLRADPATTRPAGVVEFPSVVADVAHRQVRVACDVLALDAPLEFFCVARGGPEHESVLRTPAKPSHVHAALLLIGLEPGAPTRFDEKSNQMLAPTGPPVRISCEWTDAAGQVHRVPASALMRDVRTRKSMPEGAATWVFAGSRTAGGQYLADPLGYVVAIVNFEQAMIDVPRLVSSANETLEWQYDKDAGPAKGAAMTMILEPADAGATTRAVR